MAPNQVKEEVFAYIKDYQHFVGAPLNRTTIVKDVLRKRSDFHEDDIKAVLKELLSDGLIQKTDRGLYSVK